MFECRSLFHGNGDAWGIVTCHVMSWSAPGAKAAPLLLFP
jgi:hypothetical protein